MSRQKKPCLLLICSLLLAFSGCARLDLEDRLNWKKADIESVATRMVPMWSNTVLYEPDRPGIRGFGSRIYFYEDKGNEPIAVNGSLVVYAFDSTRYDAHDTKPEKKFVFTAEQFAQHQSSSKLGESYSIWLPWDEVGGIARQITLITKFRSSDGRVIISDPARKLLPGLPEAPADDEKPAVDHYGVQQASFESEESQEQTAITIDLPPSFSRRLGASEKVEPSVVPSKTQRITDSPAAPPEEMPYRQRLADHFERARRRVQSQPPARRSSESWRNRPSPSASRPGLRSLPEVTYQNSTSYDD